MQEVQFQPTLPARGATSASAHTRSGDSISTHAPRTGSDRRILMRTLFFRNFNPRSPHGERHSRTASPPLWQPFQPTLPARGATPPPV